MDGSDNTTKMVAEIFTQAGNAFAELGELCLQLHTDGSSKNSGKWTETEVTMLLNSVTRFADDLNDIHARIKKSHLKSMKDQYQKQMLDQVQAEANVQQQHDRAAPPSAAATALPPSPPPHHLQRIPAAHDLDPPETAANEEVYTEDNGADEIDNDYDE